MDFLVAVPFGGAVVARFLPSRQVAESGDQALKLEQVGVLLPNQLS